MSLFYNIITYAKCTIIEMAIILETKTSFQGNPIIAQYSNTIPHYRYKRKTWLLRVFWAFSFMCSFKC